VRRSGGVCGPADPLRHAVEDEVESGFEGRVVVDWVGVAGCEAGLLLQDAADGEAASMAIRASRLGRPDSIRNASLRLIRSKSDTGTVPAWRRAPSRRASSVRRKPRVFSANQSRQSSPVLRAMIWAYLRSALYPGDTAWADAVAALDTLPTQIGRVDSK